MLKGNSKQEWDNLRNSLNNLNTAEDDQIASGPLTPNPPDFSRDTDATGGGGDYGDDPILPEYTDEMFLNDTYRQILEKELKENQRIAGSNIEGYRIVTLEQYKKIELDKLMLKLEKKYEAKEKAICEALGFEYVPGPHPPRKDPMSEIMALYYYIEENPVEVAFLVGDTALAMIFEPYDWFTIARDIVTDPTNPVVYLGLFGLLPLVSGSEVKTLAKTGGLFSFDNAGTSVVKAEGKLPRPGERPDWLRRMDKGNEFNKAQANRYPYNEIYIENPKGGYYRVDSYDPKAGEIISRKFTQFSEITEATGIGYLKEFALHYPPGMKIANVPTSGNLVGQKLRGQMILEIPKQINPIPKAIIDIANKLSIIIRDSKGKLYNP